MRREPIHVNKKKKINERQRKKAKQEMKNKKNEEQNNEQMAIVSPYLSSCMPTNCITQKKQIKKLSETHNLQK